MSTSPRIAVVIPCYRVASHVLGVIEHLGPEIGWIFAVDDACPENSGDLIESKCVDPRVQVLRHASNLGVGGAVMTGYRAALGTSADVIIKLDGDGQMDPGMIPVISAPLLSGQADYAKGNRFHRVSFVSGMPLIRLIGNSLLSFMTKLSTGYWQVFDPTNGYTAIHRSVAGEIDLERVAQRYFFESDLLYHLGQLRAVVVDIPMRAKYEDESSNLRPLRMIGPFLAGHLHNVIRRIIYSYFLRGFSVATLELCLGLALFLFGAIFGGWQWWHSISGSVPASAGTVMLAALPIIVGMQFLLSWVNFDVVAEPRYPIQKLLEGRSITMTRTNC